MRTAVCRLNRGPEMLGARRVLIAHPSADRYGSDLQVLESAHALAEAGWEPLLVVPGPGPLIALSGGLEVRFLKVEVMRKALMSVRGMAGLAVGSLRDLVRVVRLLHRLRPDLVYVNTVTIPIWLVAARLCRIPALAHVHEAEADHSRLVRSALAAPLLLADTVIVNSDAAATVLTDVIPRLASRIVTVYNGVPDLGVRRADAIDGRLVFVGRLSPRKGVDVALEAVARLVEEGMDVTLDVCGSVFPGYEGYEAELRKRAAAPDLAGRVQLLGYVRPVTHVLARAAALVMPSRHEPFGNVAVEALLGGCPVVASRVQGLKEVVSDGETGLLVEPNDPGALATALRSVLEDPVAARGRALRGREDALTRFSVPAYRSRICSLAERAVVVQSRARR